MDNSKYLNYYVEILTSTMSDAVIRNVSLQANARVTEDVINEQAAKIQQLQNELGKSNSGNEGVIKGHLDTINSLTKQLTELNNMKSEYENIKHQVGHVDTFRSELNKERENHQKTRTEFEDTIKQLNQQIEFLQLTPAKRKKIEEEKFKQDVVTEYSSTLPLDDTTRDGGSF